MLVAERLTLADLSAATIVLRATNVYLDNSSISKFPSVVRFVETVINQPQIAQFWAVQWPEKALTYTPHAEDTKTEEKPKTAPTEKPKKVEKPKKKEPEPEEEEDLVPREEPKANHPLDSPPKSAFNLEYWKRAYSNGAAAEGPLNGSM